MEVEGGMWALNQRIKSTSFKPTYNHHFIYIILTYKQNFLFFVKKKNHGIG